MKNQPFVWMALFFILGIIAGHSQTVITLYAWFGVGAFLLISVLCLGLKKDVRRRFASLIPILLAVSCTGILTYQVHSRVLPDNVANFINTKKTEVILRGVVVKDPERELCPDGRVRMTLVLDLKRARFDTGNVLDSDISKDTGGSECEREGKRGEEEGEGNVKGSWRPVSGDILVYVYVLNENSQPVYSDLPAGANLNMAFLNNTSYPYQYGDDLIVKAKIRKPRGPSNPGQFDYSAYLERQGIDGVAVVKDNLDVVRVGGAEGKRRFSALSTVRVQVLGWIYGLRHKMETVIEQTLPAPEKELLKAMLLGQRQGISDEMKDTFIKTGTVHILAISGLHTGLVAFAILVILKLLRLPRKLRYALAMGLLVGFALLTGLRPPVVRTTIMALILMGAVLLNREADIYNCLGLAALIMLISNPFFLFDAGFQLSFISVISIVYLYPKIEHKVFGRISAWIQAKIIQNSRSGRVEITGSKFLHISLKSLRSLIKLFSGSAAAWIGTMPVVWYYFKIISPVSVLANIFSIPLLFLSVACGLCLTLTGLAWLKMADFFWTGVCWLWLKLIIWVSSMFSQFPFGHFYLGPPYLYFILGYYILIGLIFGRIRFYCRNEIARSYIETKSLKTSPAEHIRRVPDNRTDSESMTRKTFWRRAGILVVINLIIWPSAFKNGPQKMEVTFLDVGHGDSAFLRFPNGENMLIDTGIGPPGDMGRWAVQPFLLSKGVNRLDALVLSHPHYDHIGGLGAILDSIKISHAFDNGITRDNSTYDRRNYPYKKMITGRGINLTGLKADMQISGYPGPVKIEILHPPPETMANISSDNNNNSVVLKVTYQQVDILFCGDIEEEAMRRLLVYGHRLRSHILKVPHHGGRMGPAGKLFLEQVRPRLAIISEAEDNHFGLPDEYTVSLLRQLGSVVLQTGTSGAITVTTDGHQINVQTFLK